MDDKSYYELWMRVAARLLLGELKLIAMLCLPNSDGECVNNHHPVVVKAEMIRDYAKAGLAPVVYAVPANAEIKTADDIKDLPADQVYWLGDVSWSGYVICGKFLATLTGE